jgi:two-component system chemotaxis sensor kinase CheA
MQGSNHAQMFNMLLDEIDDTLNDFENRCLKINLTSPAAELNDLFRYAHNIKGASRIYGLNEFGTFVHTLEDLLGRLRNQPEKMNPSLVDPLLRTHKLLADWVVELRKNPKHIANTLLLTSEIESAIQSLGAEPINDYQNIDVPNKVVEALPNIADMIKKRKLEAEAAKNPSPIPAESVEPAGDLSSLQKKSVSQSKKKRPIGNLKIASNKIDEIMQLIGELSIQQSILWHHNTTDSLDTNVCRNAISMNQKTIKDLQEMVLGLRMQPIDGLFQRLERSARDLARELDKKIILKMDGSNIMMDKTVIERMSDPIIHLLRNAIDHGVESDEVRLANNKSTPAVIEITATQDSGQVVIKIEDDGKGIDTAGILKKAREKGLVKDGQKFNESELIQFIFQPGFSTKDAVTEISGRGIGMEIVQQSITEIGGNIETKTRLGRGTSFHITIPTSLEIVDSLILKVANETYIVPTQDIQEILEIPKSDLNTLASDCTAIHIHGKTVPVENLSDYLSSRSAQTAVDSEFFVALLIRMSDRSLVAFRVDEIISQQQVVVRPLSDHLSSLPGFTAVGVLGNGEPALILSMSFIGECYLNWVRKNSDLRRTI